MPKTENRKQKFTRRSDNEGGTEILFGWLKICACILLLASFDSIAYSDSNDLVRVSQIIATKFDPSSLLATQSSEGEEEPDLLDIHTPTLGNLPVYYTLQPAEAPAKNFASNVKDKTSQISPPSVNTSSGPLERQLRNDRISPPNPPQRDNKRDNKLDELRQLIEQIRSVKIEPASTNPIEPHPPPQQPVETASPTAPEPAVNTAAEPAIQEATAELHTEATAGVISEQTLQKVAEQLKDPNNIANPLELAEILFKSGRTALAGLCYKKALASIGADDPNLAGERAWILFQIGNCFRDDDPNTAKESYAELIRTYPQSPWAQPAKVRHGLLEWYQADKPGELIRQFNRPNP
jgi:tetratricopeptide (TPR) repeat protein